MNEKRSIDEIVRDLSDGVSGASFETAAKVAELFKTQAATAQESALCDEIAAKIRSFKPQG